MYISIDEEMTEVKERIGGVNDLTKAVDDNQNSITNKLKTIIPRLREKPFI